MAGEEIDYTPRRRREEGPGEGKVSSPGGRSPEEGPTGEGVADYAPRPARRGRKARQERLAEEATEYTPRAARREREAHQEETEYTPRPARRQPALWQREAGRRGVPRSRSGDKFFGSKMFWRLAAVVALVVMVVPTALIALLQDDSGVVDPQLAALLDRLEQYPDDLPTLIEVGNYYFDQGVTSWNQQDDRGALSAFESAATYYQRALRQDPASVDVRTDLGTMYYYQGQIRNDRSLIEQAIGEWQVALSYEPDKPQALLNLGIGYLALDLVDQAVAMWQRVIEVAPGTSSADDAQQLLEQYGGP